MHRRQTCIVKFAHRLLVDRADLVQSLDGFVDGGKITLQRRPLAVVVEALFCRHPRNHRGFARDRRGRQANDARI